MLRQFLKKVTASLIVLTIAGFLLCPTLVFAETSTTTPPATEGSSADDQLAQLRAADSYGFYEFIYNLITSLGSGILWVGGTLLEFVFIALVVNMAGTMEAYGMSAALAGLWGIVRDLFNLLFIFGLLWIGFQLILGINDTQAKRNLVSLLVAALLINFSLYITQVVVDFSNIAAYQIYGKINSPAYENWLGYEVKNIASGFLQETAVESLKEKHFDVFEEGGVVQILILAFIVAFVLSLIGFVFAAGAFIMLTRFFYLFALMIFSPMMFLGFVLPSFKGKSSEWWHKLFSQAFVGPAYLFMIYIALRAIEYAEPKNIQSFTGYLLYLLLMAGFAWMALVVARSMGAVGATQAVNLGESMGRGVRGYTGRMAGGATAGLAAAGLRSSVGRLASKAANSESLRDAASQRGARGWMARRAFNASQKAADSSFDARNVAGVGSKLGIGEGRKGGYETAKKEVIEKEKKFAANLGEVSDDDPRVYRAKMGVEATDVAIKDKNDEIHKLRTVDLVAAGNDEEKREKVRVQIEAARADLQKLEGDKKKAEESYTAEKQRRQLGTPVVADKELTKESINKLDTEITNLIGEAKAAPTSADRKKLITEIRKKKAERAKKKKSRDETSGVDKVAIEIADIKNDINDKLKSYANTKDPVVKEHYAKEIEKKNKELERKQKEANRLAGGYADTVERSNEFKNFFTGRNRTQNEEAAKDIRKEHQKKIKGEDKK